MQRKNTKQANKQTKKAKGKTQRSDLPQPKLPRRLVATLKSETTPWRPQTRRLDDLVIGIEDKFHSSLLANVLDPSLPFPLPSPQMDPYASVVGNSGFNNYALGNIASIVQNDFKNSEVRGTTAPDYTAAGTGIGRYSRFSGKSIGTLETITDPNGQLEVWFCHDPFNLEDPVICFVPSTSGNYTGMNRLQTMRWTSHPFPLWRNYVQEDGSNPGLDIESNNLYYEGGSMLHVHTLNKNAYLTVSYQTRTGKNMQDRFVDSLPQLWTTTDPGAPLSLTDTPSEARGAISMYTGSVWSQGVRLHSAQDEGDAQFGYSETFRRCWASGAPWIRAVCRTTNAGVAATGSVQFSISLLTWNATAPRDPSLAASMPLETVPLPIPSWLRAMRTRGAIYNGQKDNLFENIWNSQVERIQQSMIPSTPMTREIIRRPETLAHVVAKSTGDSPSSSNKSTNWLETASNIVGKGLSFISFLSNLAKPVMRAAPMIEELSTVAPLLLL